jgi:ribosome-binding factor A
MRKTRRTSQVGATIRDALVEVLRRDLKDIQLGLTSITDVEVSPDLQYARVYMSGMTDEETKAVIEQLQERKGRIRSLLGQRVRMRYTPDLDFRYDETTMRASRIESILTDVMPKNETTDDDDNDNDDTDDES